ncbi:MULTISPECIES: sigma-70 family RNA polymerase sigma factor [unclassified Streptococcus]|uniref:sigma-70 family RNA polymerase sigma factor n=1 Tax=unclassified Streptococcus TaxID=2608887 RepID=UPI0018AC7A3C|nr:MULTISPECIES: sigma-70 family RNA polymerase sigma factor [unclassified Streptococcus]MBF8971136.1 sigma-70 family RNA polymerase sigma factor [Streptococcus sp. NLN76]MBG9368264.1 sigma-70 family RNA polymerase sigma factor [Streptococcus sp. NLN64]MBJ6746703.1 sigma-70 family RNA polymerase sigma factor [Streptococcus sp. 121]
MDFESTYKKVRGTVLKCHREFYLHLWDACDWEQEGMMVLYRLMKNHPSVMQDDEKLHVFFKTKFRNHIIDKVRMQEAKKRTLDNKAYVEVSEVGHLLAEDGLCMDEFVLFKDRMMEFKKTLTQAELDNYQRLISNQCFKGRKKMLKKMASYFEEFDPRK